MLAIPTQTKSRNKRRRKSSHSHTLTMSICTQKTGLIIAASRQRTKSRHRTRLTRESTDQKRLRGVCTIENVKSLKRFFTKRSLSWINFVHLHGMAVLLTLVKSGASPGNYFQTIFQMIKRFKWKQWQEKERSTLIWLNITLEASCMTHCKTYSKREKCHSTNKRVSNKSKQTCIELNQRLNYLAPSRFK